MFKVSDVKKKVTEINKRLNKDMDGFNHLEMIHRHLDEVVKTIGYMEDKMDLAAQRKKGRREEEVKELEKAVEVDAEDFDGEVEKVETE